MWSVESASLNFNASPCAFVKFFKDLRVLVLQTQKCSNLLVKGHSPTNCKKQSLSGRFSIADLINKLPAGVKPQSYLFCSQDNATNLTYERDEFSLQAYIL
jgi:hypothetical protein